MGKQAEEVLVGLLSSAYKLDNDGVAGLKEPDGSFKDDAIDELLKKDTERVATLRGEVDKLKDEQFSYGRRKALEELEKSLRDEYGYKDATKKGKELIDAIIAERLKASSGTDEEKVKTHPLFRQLEEKVVGLPKAIEEAVKAREAELQAAFETERHSALVLDEAEAEFDALRPVLSSNPTVAANQKRDFLEKVRSLKFQVSVKDGKADIVPLDAEGKKRMEDNHGHAVPFRDLIRALVTERFDMHKAEERSGGPNPDRVGKRSEDAGGKFKLASKKDYIEAWGHIERTVSDLRERERQWAELKAQAKEAGVL